MIPSPSRSRATSTVSTCTRGCCAGVALATVAVIVKAIAILERSGPRRRCMGTFCTAWLRFARSRGLAPGEIVVILALVEGAAREREPSVSQKALVRLPTDGVRGEAGEIVGPRPCLARRGEEESTSLGERRAHLPDEDLLRLWRQKEDQSPRDHAV